MSFEFAESFGTQGRAETPLKLAGEGNRMPRLQCGNGQPIALTAEADLRGLMRFRQSLRVGRVTRSDHLKLHDILCRSGLLHPFTGALEHPARPDALAQISPAPDDGPTNGARSPYLKISLVQKTTQLRVGSASFPVPPTGR